MISRLNNRLTTNWDSLLPLGTIVVFVLLGVLVAVGAIDFGLADAGVDRFQTIYTDIGVQTTAGIFAIVISLSLVAIQFAAQEYSHRIMEYYIKSSVFWSTVAVYLGLMIAAIFLQAGSTDDDSPRTVGLVLLGSVLALVLLVPHFIVTAAYLKPEFIVGKLMGRITHRYLERVLREGHDQVVGTTGDRLLPVIEIAERSIEKGDTATANSVVTRITSRYESAARASSNEADLAVYFIVDLNRIGRKAISEANEEAVAVQVIGAIAELAKRGAMARATSTIDDLLFAAVRHQQEGSISCATESLSDLYQDANPEERGLISDSISALIPRLANDGQRLLLQQLVTQLQSMIAVETPGTDGQARILELFESIGREAAVSRLIRVVRVVAVAMSEIGKGLAETNPESAQNLVLGLLRIEKSIDRSDSSAIAAVGFARAEVERLLGPYPGAESASGFSDVWDEPDQQ